jgi:polyhydroxybutyrate depolymerase
MIRIRVRHGSSIRCLLVLETGFFLGMISACRGSAPVQPNSADAADQPSPSASETCAAGDRLVQIESDGELRSYRIHVPAKTAGGPPAPVVFGFHGNAGTAEHFEAYSGFSSLADREGFLAVYPQGAGEIPTWEINAVADNPDVRFVRAAIDDLTARCAVDPDRIYATGHSRGGGMANRLACDLADRIAAIGPVSGTYPPEGGCDPARPVAVIAFHGTADPVVPYGGISNSGLPPAAYFTIGIPIPQWASAWAARNGCGSQPAVILDETYLAGSAWVGCRGNADVILYSIPDGGHGWPGGSNSSSSDFNAAQMIWDFFEKHPMEK